MKPKIKPNEFKTSDLYYAAYLQCSGVTMSGTEREGAKTNFVFDTTSSDMVELQNAWLTLSGKVSALSYANALKALKSVCHFA